MQSKITLIPDISEQATDEMKALSPLDVCSSINQLLATFPELKIIATIPELGTYEVKGIKRGPTGRHYIVDIVVGDDTMPVAVKWFQKYELFISRPALLIHYKENIE